MKKIENFSNFLENHGFQVGLGRREFPNKLPVAVIHENELLAAKAKLALKEMGKREGKIRDNIGETSKNEKTKVMQI